MSAQIVSEGQQPGGAGGSIGRNNTVLTGEKMGNEFTEHFLFNGRAINERKGMNNLARVSKIAVS